MAESREHFQARLLKGYSTYYDVEVMTESMNHLVFTAFFHIHSAKYVLLRSAEIWSADNNEFNYVFSLDCLDRPTFEICVKQAFDDGIKHIHPDKNHMSSYINAIFLCDSANADAVKALKAYRHRKNFRYSLNGWTEVCTALVIPSDTSVVSNYSSCETAKYLKKMFGKKKTGVLFKLLGFLK